MNYNAIDVAKYIIKYSNHNNIRISNLKLQKLLYYVQAASLVEIGEPMFTDVISAWKYGPVIDSVYHEFKVYADDDIFDKEISTPSISQEHKKIIKDVVVSYAEYSPIDIMLKTHDEKPWKQAWENKTTISNEIIKEYYTDQEGLIYG